MALLPAGVPALLPGSGAIFSAVTRVTGDAAGILGLAILPQWGIFDQNGQPVIVGESVLAFDYTQESHVSNYPVEQGGFESFNKVQRPYDLKFTFTQGGSVGARAAFLASVDAAQKSLALFSAFMPEKSYANLNVVHYDFRRTAQSGVTLLTVDVWCQEIRLAAPLLFSNTQNFGGAGSSGATGTTNTSNTQNPEAASPVNGGTVQAQNPSSQTTTQATTETPGAIQTPNATLTNSTGNTPPAPAASPIGSTVVYDSGDGTGPQTSTVASVRQNGTGYVLANGASVGTNTVSSITPPGYTTVQ